MARLTDEQADEWRMARFVGEVPRIDEDYFNAEQDAIEAAGRRSDDEYARVNGHRATAVIAPWNDRHCAWCAGRGHTDGCTCTACDGTGAESITYDAPEVAAAPVWMEAAE